MSEPPKSDQQQQQPPTTQPSKTTETTDILARCHCGQLSATATVPKTSLPLPLKLCACNGCRKVSGFLALSFVELPNDASQPLTVRGTSVQHSFFPTTSGDDSDPPDPDNIIRRFCGTCGTSVYDGSPDTQNGGLCSGAIRRNNGAGWNYRTDGHEYTWFSEDGGLAVWLPRTTIWDGPMQEPPLPSNYYATRPSKIPRPGSETQLVCACFCEGVKFVLTRPNEESREVAWPEDVLGRWDGGRSGSGRFLAKMCACDDCREATGYHAAPWAFVPRVNVRDPETGGRYEFDSGTLRAYSSSEGVTRHFCGRCGAKVFFRWSGREEIVDICVGLLNARSGARAEDWLEWQVGMSYAEDAKGQDIVQLLLEGMAEREELLSQKAETKK